MNLEELLAQKDTYRPMTAAEFELRHIYGYGEIIAQGIGLTSETDLHDLVKQNGGEIHYIDFAEFSRNQNIFENSIYVREAHDFDLILPLHVGRAENRYTIAHELGHYVLHAKKGMCYARRKGDTPIEHEADCFALGFLMPAAEFKRVAEQFHQNRELSIIFQVPENIIAARKHSLGI